MGGYWFEEDCQIMLPLTLVLVGKTGNGKSATGNSILGMQMFPSKRSSSAITTTSELKTTAMEDGQTLNVIDTPGLFDSSLDTEFIGKEIMSCMNKAGNVVDAFLVVISVRSRFERDETSAISRLLTLFGRKVYDYMIIVFTGGDELEEDGESLEDFLHDSSEALQETLRLCGNRCVLFNNKTKDPTKRSDQVQKLLSLVNMVSKSNGGKPYTNEIFTDMKKCTWELDEQQISVYDKQFKRIYETVESKVKETTLRLEQLLAEEQTAQLEAVENATASQNKSEKEIQNKWTSELEEHEILPCDEQFKRVFEMASYFIGREVDSKLKETYLKLEQLLGEEHTARLKAEENAKAALKKFDIELHKVESKLMERTLKFEQLLTEERTARLKAEENAKIAQKDSDMKIQKVESKLKETTLKLQEQLAEELTARLKAEENSKAAQKKSYEEIQKVDLKLMETTLKHEQLLTEEWTAHLEAKEIAKIAQKSSDDKIQKVELKLEETTLKLQEQLGGERTARLKVEENAKAAQKKSQEEILKFESKLKEIVLKLEQVLAEERTSRMKTEENLKAAQKKSEEEIQKVKLKFKETTLKLKQRLAETEKNAKAVQKKVNKILPFPSFAPAKPLSIQQ